MRYVLKVRPQAGLSYRRMLEYALAAEDAGFDGFFRSDHLRSTGAEQPTTEAWTSLAGLARDTSTIRLGTLVTPATFRSPYLLAKMVATVDEMSDGRIELGIGAGWYAAEHEPLGIALPPVIERFDRLEEQLQVIVGLWRERRLDFAGRWYSLDDAPLEPKPVQRPHPPIILGGSGRPRGLRLAARYASEFNFDEQPAERVVEVLPRLHAACAEAGREPRTLVVSAMIEWPLVAADEQAAVFDGFAQAGVERLYLDLKGGDVDPAAVLDFGRRFIDRGSGRAP